jgi:alpha-amylase/alpha-mannosidase (GH57 family)
MIYWAPLLHFYQPPTQLHWVLRKVCDESYRPLVEVFRELPYAKVTVNINAVLTEMLYDHGFRDVIEGLRELANRGQVEFTGSGKHHPILPLIPEEEMRRQIVQNIKTNRRFFGKAYSPKGFFPPEMCYGKDIVKPIIETGHQWVIISGIACPVDWPMNVIHEISLDGEKLAVFFRDDILSNKISFQDIDAGGFIDHLKQLRGDREDIYVITAMDAETFGHHIEDWEKLFLSEVYEILEAEPTELELEEVEVSTQLPLISPKGPAQTKVLAQQHGGLFQAYEAAEVKEVQAVTISELLDLFPRGSAIEPKPSSWSTSQKDIETGNPYPLWKDKDNAIHQLQWEHLEIAIEMVKKATKEAKSESTKHYADIARALLDTAFHSCQCWWASRRPMWDINLITRGLVQQAEVILNAYKAISMSDCSDEDKKGYYYWVVAARDLRNKITDNIFLTPE